MAISFVGAASSITPGDNSSTTTSAAAALPTGLASNDLILIAVHRMHNYPITATPTGYTFLENIIDSGTAPAAADTDIYYRFADGTETTTGPTFSTATATRFICECAVYRGVSVTTPFIAHGGQVTGSSTASRAAPTLSNTDANAWGVFTTGLRQLATPVSFTPPSGMTERLDDDFGLNSTANVAAEWADTNGIVGSTGSITYTALSSASTAVSIAWAAFLAVATSAGPVSGAAAAAGVGAATVGGPVTMPGGALHAAGVGAAVIHAGVQSTVTAAGAGSAFLGGHDRWTPAEPWINSAPWPAPPLPFVIHIPPALIGAGVGTASLSGVATHLAGTLAPAGRGTASVTGTVGFLGPVHVPGSAQILDVGLGTAAVLAVAPGVATLANDGTSSAELATSLFDATVLAVAPGLATVNTV